MYEPIIPSVVYLSKTHVGFTMDAESLKDLVKSTIIAVNSRLRVFARSKSKIHDKYSLMYEIGVHVEILQHAVFLSLEEKKLSLGKENQQALKRLFVRLEKLIHDLGSRGDSDFITDSATQRVRPQTELLDFVKKHWGTKKPVNK